MEQSFSWKTDSRSASQEIPRFYVTGSLVIVFTRAHHRFMSWAKWIQSTPSNQIALRFILIGLLSSHLLHS
jgi:hypothetical protein